MLMEYHQRTRHLLCELSSVFTDEKMEAKREEILELVRGRLTNQIQSVWLMDLSFLLLHEGFSKD